LEDRGYKIAPVTVENADYEINDVLADAVAQKNEALVSKTKAEYIAHTQAMFRYVEDASNRVFGHEIPQVWLIHDNAINAELLDTLLADLERRGYSFVSLDSAMTDPAYVTPNPLADSRSRSMVMKRVCIQSAKIVLLIRLNVGCRLAAGVLPRRGVCGHDFAS